jgi:Flp pilus assembly protein TadB
MAAKKKTRAAVAKRSSAGRGRKRVAKSVGAAARKRAPARKKAAARKKAPARKKSAARKRAPARKKAAARKKSAARKQTRRAYALYNDDPWSTRPPQSLVLTVVVLVVLVGVVIAAFDYLGRSRGGVVPPLMLAVAPVLAIYYVWYFNFSRKS